METLTRAGWYMLYLVIALAAILFLICVGVVVAQPFVLLPFAIRFLTVVLLVLAVIIIGRRRGYLSEPTSRVELARFFVIVWLLLVVTVTILSG